MEWQERNRIEREAVKAADVGSVFYKLRSYDQVPTEVKVVRVTKTQLVLDDGIKLSREHGRPVSADRYGPSYTPACPHVIERFKEAKEAKEAKFALDSAMANLKEFASNTPDKLALAQAINSLLKNS